MPAARKPKFRVYRSGRGAQPWRWALVAGNGETIASGEGHGSQHDAARAVETVRECALVAELVLVPPRPTGPQLDAELRATPADRPAPKR